MAIGQGSEQNIQSISDIVILFLWQNGGGMCDGVVRNQNSPIGSNKDLSKGTFILFF